MSYDIDVNVNNIKDDSHADDLTLHFDGGDIDNFSRSLSSSDVSGGSITHNEEDLEGEVTVIIDYPSESPWYETQNETTTGGDITFDLELETFTSNITILGVDFEATAEAMTVHFSGDYIDDYEIEDLSSKYDSSNEKVEITESGLKGEIDVFIEIDYQTLDFYESDETGMTIMYVDFTQWFASWFSSFDEFDFDLSPVNTDFTGDITGPEEEPYSISITLYGIQESSHVEHFQLIFSGEYMEEDFIVEFEPDNCDDGVLSLNTGEYLIGDVTAKLIIDNEAIRGHSDPISDGELDYKQRSWDIDDDTSINYNVFHIWQYYESSIEEQRSPANYIPGEYGRVESEIHEVATAANYIPGEYGRVESEIHEVATEENEIYRNISLNGIGEGQGNISFEQIDPHLYLSFSGIGEGQGNISFEQIDPHLYLSFSGIGKGKSQISSEKLILAHRVNLNGKGNGMGLIDLKATQNLYINANGIGNGYSDIFIIQTEGLQYLKISLKGKGLGKGRVNITSYNLLEWDPIESLKKTSL